MSIVEQSDCVVEYLTSKGTGVGKTDQGMVELPYVLPQETIHFTRHQYRRRRTCTLNHIVKPSEERRTPPCPYFGRCGGCLLQHASEEFYNDFLQKQLSFCLDQHHLYPELMDPIITIAPGHRRRINMDGVKKDEGTFLGFHRFKSHQIININECLLLTPPMDGIIAPTREMLDSILFLRQKAKIFITQTQKTPHHNGIDIILEIQLCHDLEPWQEENIQKFSQHHQIARFQFRHRKKYKTIYESPHGFPHVLFDGVMVEVNAHSFLQATQASDDILADLVTRNIPIFFEYNQKEIKIMDLFCGRGTLTFPLSRYGKVIAIDSEKDALKALETANKKANRPITVHESRDLFSTPLTRDEFQGIDLVVINPPRAGALEQIHHLAHSNIAMIVYVSCNPQTFCRDGEFLVNAGYDFVQLSPLDQFMYNPHLEVVGIFARR